jgi:hypothetical protein
MTFRRLLAVIVFFLSLPASARASFIFNIRSSPDQQVLQGQDGRVIFRVFSPFELQGEDMVIDSLDISFEYEGSIDPLDEITKIAKVGGTCGVGSIVTFSTPCTYIVGFVTDDPRRPLDPNKDYGLWDIFLDVSSHQLTDPDNTGTGNGVALVAVLDPGANFLPEPGTFGLASLSLACLIAGSLRRRRTG